MKKTITKQLSLLHLHCYSRGCWIHYTTGGREYSQKYSPQQTARILQELGRLQGVHNTRSSLYVTGEVESISVDRAGRLTTSARLERMSWKQYSELFPLGKITALQLCAYHHQTTH